MDRVSGTDLSGTVLVDPDGNPARLGDVVDRPTVIDLVRYYGCAPCLQQLKTLTGHYERIRKSGGDVLGIGPRAAYQARHLVERGRVPFRLLLDPEHSVARGVGLGRQSFLRWIFGFRAWWRWLKAFFRSGQGMVTGGWWELPAILVVDAECRLHWAHLGGSMGDYPPIEETLAQLESVIDRA